MTVLSGLRREPALGRRLGAGGEAEVYEVDVVEAGRGRAAYKRYRRPTAERAAKLQVMVAHPPTQAEAIGGHIAIAWPQTLVSSDGGRVDGFLMPKVDLARAVPLFQVYNPQSRALVAPGFTWRYLLRAARNVAAIVASLHDAGYVIGDLNESNFLVTDRALVVLVDCDSMQVRDPETGTVHRGAVGKPEFLAPEFHGVDLARTDRTVESDRFALAILAFLLLMEGVHPFAGVWKGRGEPPDLPARMRHRLFPYQPWTRLRPSPLGLPLRVLPRPVRTLVWRTFTTGAKRARRRPSAREWVHALERAEERLRECRRSPQHVYGRAVRRCPWCARIDAGLPDPFPAADGTGVAARPPSWAWRWWMRTRRAGRMDRRARLGAALIASVVALAVVVWLVPLAGAVAALAAPAGTRVVCHGDGSTGWWRWRSLTRRVRLAREGFMGGIGRMHWTAAAATAGAAVSVLLLETGPWTAGRVALATAALTHVLANLPSNLRQ
jgi:hypothetical protein